MLFDLHVHSQFSECSSLSIDDIIHHARSRGLDGVCITDHFSEQAREHLSEGVLSNGLRIFVGQEYQTPEGDFLIFCPGTRISRGLCARHLLKLVQSAGGAAIAAHPLRSSRPTAEHIIREQLCHIVESINGRNKPSENHAVGGWRQKYTLVECAGSDAHSLTELGNIKTRFQKVLNTPADLVHALNNGLCAPYLNGQARMPSPDQNSPNS